MKEKEGRKKDGAAPLPNILSIMVREKGGRKGKRGKEDRNLSIHNLMACRGAR